MRILAIETASPPGSACLLDTSTNGSIFRPLEDSRRTTEQFAVLIQALLQQQQWTSKSIDLVAVCLGPGSFTGLRIGFTAAKTFAYAVGCEIIAINTLEVIARQTRYDGDVVAVLDAQRGQIFSATFSRSGDNVAAMMETRILDEDAWLKELRAGQHVSGLGLKKLESRLPDSISIAEKADWQPRADTLAQTAFRKFSDGQRDDLWTLRPAYYRRSAAEENADLGKA